MLLQVVNGSSTTLHAKLFLFLRVLPVCWRSLNDDLLSPGLLENLNSWDASSTYKIQPKRPEGQDYEDHHLDCSIKPGEPKEEGTALHALESFTTCSRVGTRATHFQKLLDAHIYPCIYSIFTPIHTCEHAIWEWHQQRMCSSIMCQNMCVVPELHAAVHLSRHWRVSVFFRFFLTQMQSESHLTSGLSRTAT